MKITLVIDGNRVEIEKDTMLIRAIQKAGITVPTLCHHEAIRPYGSCRLCVVEVLQAGATKIVTSCSFPVEGPMEVFTDTNRVRNIRRMVMSLLLARCPDSSVIRIMARQLGADLRAKFQKGGQECILCGLCVRFCEEVVGVQAIGLSGRGIDRAVSTPFRGSTETCIGCGSCSYICPTGCIEMVRNSDFSGMSMIIGKPSSAPCPNRYQCSSCEVDRRFTEELKCMVARLRSRKG